MQKSTFWILVVGLIIIILINPLGRIFTFNGHNSWGGWMMGPGHFMGGPMFLFPLIILIVVLVVIYRIFFDSGSHTPDQDPRPNIMVSGAHESALDILKKRGMPRGELSQAEFEQMKKDLQD